MIKTFSPQQVFRTLSFWTLVTALFVCIIFGGGTRDHVLSLTHMLILTAAALQLPLFFLDRKFFTDLKRLVLPGLFFLAFLGLAMAQYFEGLAVQQGGLGTFNRYATFQASLQILFYALFFFVFYKSIARREYWESLTHLLAYFVLMLTLWGLAETIMHREILWSIAHSSQSFGPFLNSNHYGALVVMTLPLFVVQLQFAFKKVKYAVGRGESPVPWWRYLETDILLLLVVIVLSFGACILCDARLAVIVIAMTFLFLACVGFKKHAKLFLVLASILIIGTAGFLYAYGTDNILRTFGFLSLKSAVLERLTVAQESFQLFHRNPLFGNGLGSYASISTGVVSVLAGQFVWANVHNDYVELLVEMGSLGFFLFMGLIAVIVGLALLGMRKDRSSWANAMLFQGVFCVWNLALLEAGDFNLKIPAIALFFTLQLAVLLRFSRSDNPESSGVPAVVTSKIVPSIAAVTMAVLIAFLGVVTLNRYNSYQLSQAESERASRFEMAALLQPLNAERWRQLGVEYHRLAKEESSPHASALFAKARDAFKKTTEQSPMFAVNWLHLSQTQYALGDRMQGLAAVEKAAALAPFNKGYSLHLLSLYLMESDHSVDDSTITHYRDKAKKVYEHLNRLGELPSFGEQRRWMGTRYSQQFQGMLEVWASPGKGASL